MTLPSRQTTIGCPNRLCRSNVSRSACTSAASSFSSSIIARQIAADSSRLAILLLQTLPNRTVPNDDGSAGNGLGDKPIRWSRAAIIHAPGHCDRLVKLEKVPQARIIPPPDRFFWNGVSTFDHSSCHPVHGRLCIG